MNGNNLKGWHGYSNADRTDFATKLFGRHKEGHYILIRGAIYRECIVIVNTYAPNVGSRNFTKQTVMDTKGQMDPNRIIVGDSIPILISA